MRAQVCIFALGGLVALIVNLVPWTSSNGVEPEEHPRPGLLRTFTPEPTLAPGSGRVPWPVERRCYFHDDHDAGDAEPCS